MYQKIFNAPFPKPVLHGGIINHPHDQREVSLLFYKAS